MPTLSPKELLLGSLQASTVKHRDIVNSNGSVQKKQARKGLL